MIPIIIMAPNPIKLVEPYIDFAALFVAVVDGEDAVEVEFEVKVKVDDNEEVVVVVVGTEK